jgi:hypothetical protein
MCITQVQREMDSKEYMSGSFFSNMVMPASSAVTTAVKKPLGVSGSFTAPPSSFYGPAKTHNKPFSKNTSL